MDTKWFYAEGNKPIGPISFEEVVRLIKASPGERHFVWTEGMAEWHEARTLPAFADALRSLPPPLTAAVTESAGRAVGGPSGSPAADSRLLHPWRRYFARVFDVYVFTLCGGFALGVMVPDIFSESSTSSRVEDQLFTILAFAAYVPFEAFCLYAFGSTLGKTLYGVMLHPSGGRIVFSQALKRSALVWLKGWGLALPIVSLFTLIIAYNRLKRNGSTSWDDDLKWSVAHSQFGTSRWVGILACWAGITFVIVVLAYLGKQ